MPLGVMGMPGHESHRKASTYARDKDARAQRTTQDSKMHASMQLLMAQGCGDARPMALLIFINPRLRTQAVRV
eukprot:5049085-Pyramimonas_sp.AAC.1